jgi:hypothetical protein
MPRSIGELLTPLILILAALLEIGISAAHAEDIIGRARVVDGDTIEIGGTRIRLFGIDAPEGGQTCARESGAVYDCGAEASRALAALVARGRTVCDPKDIDRFKRPVAVCYTRGLDLGAELVFQGWAAAMTAQSSFTESAVRIQHRLSRVADRIAWIIFLGGFMDTETRERMRVAEPSVILVTPVTDTQIIGAVGIATYRPGSLRPSRQAPAPQLLPEPVPAVQVRQS